MNNNPLKRKEVEAESPLESPKKKPIVSFQTTPSDTKLSQPCTTLSASGKFVWRSRGIESYSLLDNFKLYKATEGRKGINYKNPLERDILDQIRKSRTHWDIYDLEHFSTQFNRYANRFRQREKLETSLENQRNKF